MLLISYGPVDPVALLLVVVLCNFSQKAEASFPIESTPHIDRYLHGMYSLPYGSPHRRINKEFKNKNKK